MKRRDTLVALLALGIAPGRAFGQQARVYRIGIIHFGGIYTTAIDGLRDGLKSAGLLEGKHYVLHLRDAKGDQKLIEGLAQALERENVDLIFSLTTSASVAARRATSKVPIVFYAGSDPVVAGLVPNFREPGGRVTGVYSRFTDLAAKRLELLKVLVPQLRNVVVFYNPENVVSRRYMDQTRRAAQQLKIGLVEKFVTSPDELRSGLRALRPGEADAFAYSSDGLVISHSNLVIEAAKALKMPTMFADGSLVARGGFASYGESYYHIGVQAAGLVHKVLKGTDPGKLPVESLDRLQFVVNLKTAKGLGLTVPEAALMRADEVIR